MISAVVFDMDGVLLDSESLWDQARREVVSEHGGRWLHQATRAMQGMSSLEWSRYMRDELDVHLDQDTIIELVLRKLLAGYERHLPLLPGALEAVRRIGRRWPLALASSSNRIVIDDVLAVAGLRDLFQATVSSEEVARGKPAPDVYLEAARKLGQAPTECAAIEDSANGIRSALAAGMRCVAIPNHEYPPPDDVLNLASVVVRSLDELTVEVVDRLAAQ